MSSANAVRVAVVLAVAGFSREAVALPAFPGAEGFGAPATGGRGGQVIKVTTLAASGPGSLQAALDVSGPRIIVFAVSGVIQGDITITHGNVTIAGQTAPGAGITINGRLFGAYNSSVGNFIVRHLRVRPVFQGGQGDQFDGIQISLNNLVILDHVSVSWGVDETVDLYEADNVTVQWCTIEESATTGHPEGVHNYGLIQGPDGWGISVHHNLFIHHKNRNPAIANGPAEVLNNVAYNVRHGFVHHNPASGEFNIAGNVYIQGPNDSLIPFYFDDEDNFAAPDLSYYLDDNYIDDPGDYIGVVDNPWQTPYLHPTFANMLAPQSLRSTQPHVFGGQHIPVTTQPSTQVLALVTQQAGAFPRDVVTLRMLDELANGTGDWGVDLPNSLMDGLTPGTYPTDADNDGMADAWETSHGLNPQNGQDHTSVMPSGYTAIEEYINEVADGFATPPPGEGEGGSSGTSVSSGTSSSSSSSTSGSGGSGGGGPGNGHGKGHGNGHGNGHGHFTNRSAFMPEEDAANRPNASACALPATPSRDSAALVALGVALAFAFRRRARA